MLGKVKSVIKKVGSAITGAASKVATSLGASATSAYNTITSGGAGNFNNAPTSSKPGGLNQTLIPSMSTPLGLGATNPNTGQTVVYGKGGQVNQVATAFSNPSSLGGGQAYLPSPIYSSPVTLFGGQKPSYGIGTNLSLGGTSTASASMAPLAFSESGFSSINSESSAPSSPISLPSAPTYGDVGPINNGGFVNSMTTVDPTNNFITPAVQGEVTQDASADAQKRNTLYEKLSAMIPRKESVYESPEVRAQMEEVNRRKQEVANYSSQLNAVVAQQNADLLRLRGVGAAEGVTETVYGGQAATINREAAIKALPIQAQLSAAQGNLELAQDFLTQLSTFKKEQIDNDYLYKKAVFDSISEYVKGEDKRLLDEKKTQNDRAWQLTRDNISLQDSLMKEAINSGQPGLISRISSVNPTSPNFRAEIANVASGLASANSATNTGGYSSKQLTALSKLNEDVSKSDTYKKTNSMRTYANNVAEALSLGTGAGDLAAINQFQKVIDEGAVTRDQDVKLIQSSQSLANSLQTKVKKLQKGEQLSPTLRTQMRTAVESIYNAQVKALQSDPYIKSKTRQAELNGLTPADTILGELGGFQKTSTTPLAPGSSGQTSSGLKFQILPD